MLKIDDIIELKSADSLDKLAFETRYLVHVNFTFGLTLKNDHFSGRAHFCIRKDEIENLCKDLEQMLASLNGTSKLSDNDSDAIIEFAINTDNQVFILGQVGGSHEDTYMQYKFTADIIAIHTFIKDLKNLLKYVDDEEYEGQYNYKNKPK